MRIDAAYAKMRFILSGEKKPQPNQSIRLYCHFNLGSHMCQFNFCKLKAPWQRVNVTQYNPNAIQCNALQYDFHLSYSVFVYCTGGKWICRRKKRTWCYFTVELITINAWGIVAKRQVLVQTIWAIFEIAISSCQRAVLFVVSQAKQHCWHEYKRFSRGVSRFNLCLDVIVLIC